MSWRDEWEPKVYVTHTTTYAHINGKKVKVREEFFDKSGKKTKEIQYDTKGNVKKVITYSSPNSSSTGSSSSSHRRRHHSHRSSVVITKQNVVTVKPEIVKLPPERMEQLKKEVEKMEKERKSKPVSVEPEKPKKVEMIIVTPPSKAELEEHAKKVGEFIKMEKESRMSIFKPKSERELRLEILEKAAPPPPPPAGDYILEEKKLKELRTVGTKDVFEGAGLSFIGAGIGMALGGPVGAMAGFLGTAAGYAAKRGLEVGLASVLKPEPGERKVVPKIRDITAPVYKVSPTSEVSSLGTIKTKKPSTSEMITTAGDIAFLTVGAAAESAAEKALTSMTPKKVSHAFVGDIYPIGKNEIAARGKVLSVVKEDIPFGRRWEVEEPFSLRAKTLISETKGKSSFTEISVGETGYGHTARGGITKLDVEKTFSATKVEGVIGEQKVWEVRASEDLIGKGMRVNLLDAGRKSATVKGIESTKDVYAVRMLDYSSGKTTSRIEIKDFVHYESNTARGLFTVGEMKKITKELPKPKDIPKLRTEVRIEEIIKPPKSPIDEKELRFIRQLKQAFREETARRPLAMEYYDWLTYKYIFGLEPQRGFIAKLEEITAKPKFYKDTPRFVKELKPEKIIKASDILKKEEKGIGELMSKLDVKTDIERPTGGEGLIQIQQVKAIAETITKRIPKIKLKTPVIAPAVSFVEQLLKAKPKEKTLEKVLRKPKEAPAVKLIPKVDITEILKQKPKEIRKVKTVSVDDIMEKIKQTQKERQKQVPKTIRGTITTVEPTITLIPPPPPPPPKPPEPIKLPKPELPKVKLPTFITRRRKGKRSIAEKKYKWKSILKLFFS